MYTKYILLLHFLLKFSCKVIQQDEFFYLKQKINRYNYKYILNVEKNCTIYVLIIIYKIGVSMSLIVQLLIFILIALSTILVIGIPVTFASPGQWAKSKNLVYTGSGLWAGLVIITGVINSFVV